MIRRNLVGNPKNCHQGYGEDNQMGIIAKDSISKK